MADATVDRDVLPLVVRVWPSVFVVCRVEPQTSESREAGPDEAALRGSLGPGRAAERCVSRLMRACGVSQRPRTSGVPRVSSPATHHMAALYSAHAQAVSTYARCT